MSVPPGAPAGLGRPADQPPSALVAGASRGIGRAIAERLAAGFSLTLSGRRPDALDEVACALAGTGVELETVAADMAAEDDVRRLAHRHAQRFGAMDLLVLCAGFGTSGALASYPVHRFDRQVMVNLRNPFVLVQECLPSLRRAAAARPERGARVVAIASLTGVAAEPGLAAYGATKAALISLCQSVNVEESAAGISATAIAPGYVDTDMSSWVHDRIDPADMIEPGDIAELVAALARLSALAEMGALPGPAGTDAWAASAPVTVPPAGLVPAGAAAARDAVILAAAEAVGAATEVLRRSVAYAKLREQFGQPIGHFQAIKHRLANMHCGAELAASALAWACFEPDETPRALRAALAGCLRVAEQAVQVHGGIGYTWEAAPHRYYRHIMAMRRIVVAGSGPGPA